MSKIKDLLQEAINVTYWGAKEFKTLLPLTEQEKLQKEAIENQRDLLNEKSIFLVCDFRDAVQPLAKNDSIFVRYYREGASDIMSWFTESPQVLPIYRIPLVEVKEDNKTKKNVVENHLKEVDEYIEALSKLHDHQEGHYYWDKTIYNKKQYRAMLMESGVSCLKFSGFRLKDLGELLDESGYQRYEDGAIKRGKGKLVHDFWQSMHTLTDYKHLFPENHSGGRKPKEDRSLKEFVPAFVPIGFK